MMGNREISRTGILRAGDNLASGPARAESRARELQTRRALILGRVEPILDTRARVSRVRALALRSSGEHAYELRTYGC